MFVQRRILRREFTPSPEVALMDGFPQDVPWSITQESAGLSAKVNGRERCFHEFRAALCWIAIQLGVPVV